MNTEIQSFKHGWEELQTYYVCGEDKGECKVYLIQLHSPGRYLQVEKQSHVTFMPTMTSDNNKDIEEYCKQLGGLNFTITQWKNIEGRLSFEIKTISSYKTDNVNGMYATWDEAVAKIMDYDKTHHPFLLYYGEDGEFYYATGPEKKHSPFPPPHDPTIPGLYLWKYKDHKEPELVVTSESWLWLQDEYIKKQLKPVYKIDGGDNRNNRNNGAWNILDTNEQIIGTEKSLPYALDLARKLRRESEYARDVKNNTRITFPCDEAVYIINDGTAWCLIEVSSQWSFFPFNKTGYELLKEGDNPQNTGTTIDTSEKWLDENFGIRYIIRNYDGKYYAYIGRYAETTGFTYTDQKTAVLSTIEIHMNPTKAA